MLENYLPVLLQLGTATGFAIATLLMSVALGKSAKRTKIKDTPYECGMLPVGEGQPRFSVKFYIVAMLFVIFDIEVVFLYPWATSFRMLIAHDPVALLSMFSFVGILLVAYIYALKKGALNWNES